MFKDISQLRNFLYFYRRKIFYHSIVAFSYTTLCWKARKWDNEVIKMGVAGSMAVGSVEAMFHFVDTVNIKSKANEKESHSAMTMVRKIWASEGVVGFGRGIGAAVYGNFSAGFIYFILYKTLKNKMPELGGFKALIAGFIAETIAILIKFPFDLIKCRLQSVNYIFKYSDWTHGIRKEFRLNGVPGLYTGVLPYLFTYTTFTALQFSIYEKTLKYFKSSMPIE